MEIFDGHQLYKIGNDWVFDITEFIGYKVNSYHGNVKSYEKAFRVEKDLDSKDLRFTRYMSVPIGTIRKTREIINNHYKEAMLNG